MHKYNSDVARFEHGTHNPVCKIRGFQSGVYSDYVFWLLTLCSFISKHHCFRRTSCHHMRNLEGARGQMRLQYFCYLKKDFRLPSCNGTHTKNINICNEYLDRLTFRLLMSYIHIYIYIYIYIWSTHS